MSRDWQLRSGRVLCFGLASFGPPMGSVAEKLKDSKLMEWFAHRRGPRGVDLRLVWSALNVCFNVEMWASPAHGGRTFVPAECPVDLKSAGGRARAW